MIRDPSDGSVRQQPAGIDALRAKYGENWGLKSLDEPKRKPKPAPTKEELAAHYAKHNLGFTLKSAEIDGE